MVEGLGSLVALTLGFAVGRRARHACAHDDIYTRLQSPPAQRFPNLGSVASRYAEHWSDRAFSYRLESVLAAMEAAAGADPAR
jgi:hypothetical protein